MLSNQLEVYRKLSSAIANLKEEWILIIIRETHCTTLSSVPVHNKNNNNGRVQLIGR